MLSCTLYDALYYLLMPMTMLATGFTFNHNPFNQGNTKLLNIRFIIQGILLLYTIILMFYVMYSLNPGGYTLGIPTYEIGPLLSFQLKVNIALSLFFLISHLYQVGAKKAQYNVWWNMAILSIFLSLTYDSMLYGMDSFETLYKALIQSTAILISISIIASLFIWLVTKIRHNRLKL